MLAPSRSRSTSWRARDQASHFPCNSPCKPPNDCPSGGAKVADGWRC